MKILGVSSYHHDSAAASVKDGLILGAAHEERFTRKKYDNSFPHQTIEWLRNTYEDWEFAAFYEESTYSDFKSDIRKITKAQPVLVDHHEAHAMSSIIMTDWTECAVMVVDTVGGKFSTSLGVYNNGRIEWIKRFRYPNSLGLFYSSATRLLGFEPLSGESQVMAAAGYGSPKWSQLIKDRIINLEDGNYTLLHDLRRGAGFGVLDWDVAASVQQVFTEIVYNLADWLYRESGMTNLAYAGGCALNCVTNSYLARYSAYDNIAIQPAAGDAGAAPRALGNRSLLCAPIDDTIERLNKIKGRDKDSWRPYAPIVQDKEADNFFHMVRPCSNMLFTADIKEQSNFKTHDMTGRVQYIDGSQPYLYKVLEITRQFGYPILINTSLNARGKPMVNKKEDLDEIRLHY